MNKYKKLKYYLLDIIIFIILLIVLIITIIFYNQKKLFYENELFKNEENLKNLKNDYNLVDNNLNNNKQKIDMIKKNINCDIKTEDLFYYLEQISNNNFKLYIDYNHIIYCDNNKEKTTNNEYSSLFSLNNNYNLINIKFMAIPIHIEGKTDLTYNFIKTLEKDTSVFKIKKINEIYINILNSEKNIEDLSMNNKIIGTDILLYIFYGDDL